jgi:hypothetical protein
MFSSIPIPHNHAVISLASLGRCPVLLPPVATPKSSFANGRFASVDKSSAERRAVLIGFSMGIACPALT